MKGYLPVKQTSHLGITAVAQPQSVSEYESVYLYLVRQRRYEYDA